MKRARVNILCLVLIALLVSSCGFLRLEQHVRSHPDDWTMYGGSAARLNSVPQSLSLPLRQSWKCDTGSGFGNGTPTVTDSLVFVCNLQGELHVINITSGRRIGYTDLGSAIAGSPVSAGDYLYAGLAKGKRCLVAYNLRTGTIQWEADVSEMETSPLMLVNHLYVTTLDGFLVCVENISGRVEWQFQVPQRDMRVGIRSSPASDGQMVFFGADDGKVYAVRTQDKKLAWTFSSKEAIVATPSVTQGVVYVGSLDQHMYAIRADSGVLVWKRDLGSPIYGSQAISGDRLFVGTADGTLHCLDAQSGSPQWSFLTSSVIGAAPLVAGSVVFIGSLDKHLYALDALTGTLLWKKELGARLRSSPVVWGKYLVLNIENRSVIALEPGEENSP